MKPIFLIVFVLAVFHANSQEQKIYIKDSNKIFQARRHIVDLEKIKVDSIQQVHHKMPFGLFEIRDVRFDTNYVGVRVEPFINFKKVQLQNGTANSIENFLNNNQSHSFTPHPSRLICYLKTFRVSQKDSLIKETNTSALFNLLYFELDAYLEAGHNFYPAFRVDTLVILQISKPTDFSVIAETLYGLARKASGVDTSKIFKRNHYTIDSLENRYAKRFNKPILESAEIKEGVYKTFTEFINNQPGITEYQIKDEQRLQILYTKSGPTDWIPTRDVFGFFDGNSMWIKAGNTFYPLIRVGNTFEFIGNRNPFNKSNSTTLYYVPGDAPLSIGLTSISVIGNNREKYIVEKFVFQMNMETGEFY